MNPSGFKAHYITQNKSRGQNRFFHFTKKAGEYPGSVLCESESEALFYILFIGNRHQTAAC